MNPIRRYLLLLALLLSGCVTQPPAPVEEVPETPPPPVVTKPLPAIPPASALEYPDAMLSVPKTHHYNWHDAIAPMIDSLSQATAQAAAGVLLVSAVNNRTNGVLATDEASRVLREALTGNKTFTLVSLQQVAQARQQLGLSVQDKLASRGKALSIARAVGAQYALYSTVSGSLEAPALQLQLLLVQSGEIIWSGSGVAQKQ